MGENILSNIIKGFVLICTIFIVGCSSGEYDIEVFKINYTEKTLKIDTIRKIVETDQIKEDLTKFEDIKETKKDSYTFIVQIGAFIVKSFFENFYSNAQQKLGDGVYFEMQNNLFKIRIGNFSNRAEAILLLNKVKAIGYEDAFIISRKK